MKDRILSKYADVVVVEDPLKPYIESVTAVYHNYSYDGVHIINETETVINVAESAGPITWRSALFTSGGQEGSRITSPDGYTQTIVPALTGQMFYAGYMTTTIDGTTYTPPLPADISDPLLGEDNNPMP